MDGRTDTAGSGPLPGANRSRRASRRTRTCDGALHAHTDQSDSQMGLPHCLPLRMYGAWTRMLYPCTTRSIHRKIRSSAVDDAKLRAVAWKAEARHGPRSRQDVTRPRVAVSGGIAESTGSASSAQRNRTPLDGCWMMGAPASSQAHHDKHRTFSPLLLLRPDMIHPFLTFR